MEGNWVSFFKTPIQDSRKLRYSALMEDQEENSGSTEVDEGHDW
jgi:hypothetical protein